MKYKPQLTSLLVWILVLFCFSSTNAQAIDITISANQLIYDSYNKWTATTPVQQITNFNNPNANRGTVELVLICQALNAAGLNYNLTVKPYPNYARALMEAEQGKVHISAEVLWDVDINVAKLYKTDAVIRDGEYEKGVYTRADNTPVLGTRNLDQLRQFSAIMPKTWKVDWGTLETMQISNLQSAARKDQIFKMIANKRADFTLLEFSQADDMSNELDGIKLVPVPNIKVGLKGSRHFVVSRKAPNSEMIFTALNKGIGILRSRGVIRRAYTQSGFFNSKVSSWQKIF